MVNSRNSTEAYIRSSVTANNAHEEESLTLPRPNPVDSALTPRIPFTPLAVSMHGYDKRCGEVYETFILRNETHNYHISRVLIRLLYTMSDGTVIADREVYVDCDLKPGAIENVRLKSFENAKNYYYYTHPPKRRSGIPYKVQYGVLRYDVVVQDEQ